MKLKELRQNANLTQAELSKQLGIPCDTYKNYELGRTQMDYRMIIKIADFFDVSLDYLFEHPYNNRIGYLPKQTTDIINKILTLNEHELQRVDDFLSGLKKYD